MKDLFKSKSFEEIKKEIDKLSFYESLLLTTKDDNIINYIMSKRDSEIFIL